MNSQPDTGETERLADPPPVVINRVLVFAIVALTLLMMSVDSTIVATVLHALQHGLDTSVNWAGWTLTAYFFGFVIMLPISGRLSEQYGRRRVSDKDIPSSVAGDEEAMVALLLRTGCQFSCLRLCLEIEAFT